jgi:GTP-binding protein
VPTPELNRSLRAWQEAHPPPTRQGRRARIMYAVQAGVGPPTFVLFVRGGELAPDYLRFLEGRLRGQYDFLGTPLRLVTRSGRRAEQAFDA